MQERDLSTGGPAVGVVGLGCWQLGGDWGDVSDDAALGVLDAATAAGTTFLDTADVYGDGRSETTIGRFLASGEVKSASAGVALPPAALPGVPGMAVTRLKLSPASVVRSTLPLRSSR